MKIRQHVNYYDPGVGKPQEGVVVAIVGAGPSLAKVLDIRVGSGENAFDVKDVPHGTNASGGEPFWLIRGVEKAPTGWAEATGPENVVAIEDAAVASTEAIDRTAEVVKDARKRSRPATL